MGDYKLNYFRFAVSPTLEWYRTRNITDISEPAFGSILYCYLYGGVCEHSGIYVGNNEIVHLNGDGLVEKVNSKKFRKRLEGKNIATHIYVSCKGLTAVGSRKAGEIAIKLIGKQYNYSITNFNCHAFTALCFEEDIKSKSSTSWHNKFIYLGSQHLPHYLHTTAMIAATCYGIYDSCANKYEHIAKTCIDVDNWRIWDTK
ncbi:hypothetical protein I6F48_04235 [Pseudoalteromonas sp. SWYJ118]|uniref:hypothetical protein n=1 Tax=Pseudoalteromonas sp. SWYJ118 TaxID=2792062 RepID=UPI0018CCD9FB|nr:hypothetical protein [Pseudoalteromonas sp. SWYJ118]MBH0074774.1 hypothetical protein [Pseudoalteromonas sp. SWYJ118]